ncbi:hypothetical protein M0R72_07060 [Candidatus Pacearchaeota archaeon]|jgi:hypothetical protein|nr:hypothetical protein [Candidatus Pacearchaeota archaeon]
MSILIELKRGVPSEYFIVSFGHAEYYCDEDGLINEIVKNLGNEHHPAYTSSWNIKRFDRAHLALNEVSVADVARFVHKATKIYLKNLVDAGLKPSTQRI